MTPVPSNPPSSLRRCPGTICCSTVLTAVAWLAPLTLGACADRSPSRERSHGGLAGQPTAEPPEPAPAKEPAMPDVTVAVTVLKPDAIAGESFPVRIAVVNRGGFPIAVHSGLGSSPISFQILGEADRVLMTLSDASTLGRTQPDRAPPPRPQLDTLAQGQGKIYEQDAFRAALQPLMPGSYGLVAIYRYGEGRWQSPPAPFTLRAPSVTAFAAVGSAPSRTLAWVLADSAAGGPAVMFARESSEEIAGAGVAYRVASLPAGRGPSSCAVAEELGEWQGARWSAWIRDGQLTACLSAAGEAFVTTEPVPTGLESATLLPVARQHDAAVASFLVTGTSAGKPRLKEFTVRRAQAPAVREINLPAVPDRRSAICFEQGPGGTTTYVVLGAGSGASTSVVVRAVGPTEAGEAGATRTLLQSPHRIVAIASPTSVTAASLATIVLAKDDKKGLELAAVPLGGGKAGPARELPALPLEPGETAGEWAVGESDAGGAPVMVVTSRRVLVLPASASGWSEIGSGVGASRPQIARVGTACWAVWLSVTQGVMYAPLTDPAPEAPADEPDAASVENPR